MSDDPQTAFPWGGAPTTVYQSQTEKPLDHLRVTASMRRLAQLAGVTDSDDAIRAWHAGASRRAAEAAARNHTEGRGS